MVSTMEMAKELVEAMEAATIVAQKIFGGIKNIFISQIFFFSQIITHTDTETQNSLKALR